LTYFLENRPFSRFLLGFLIGALIALSGFREPFGEPIAFLAIGPTIRLTHRRLQASRSASTPVTGVLNEDEAAALTGHVFACVFLTAAGASHACRTDRSDYGLFIEMHLARKYWQVLMRWSKPSSGRRRGCSHRYLEGTASSFFLGFWSQARTPDRLALWPLSPRRLSSFQYLLGADQEESSTATAY
jgi:hypothetical protein